jgi:hypothetical protein
LRPFALGQLYTTFQIYKLIFSLTWFGINSSWLHLSSVGAESDVTVCHYSRLWIDYIGHIIPWLIYMVPSKCSQNHFISEKYKTLQQLKLHFLWNSRLVQLYTYASSCKGIGNIPGGHFVKAFSALPSHS